MSEETQLCQTSLFMSLDCLLQRKDWPERKLMVREQREGKNPWHSFSLESPMFSKFSNFHTLHAHTSTNQILIKWTRTSSRQKELEEKPKLLGYNTDKITTTFSLYLVASCLWFLCLSCLVVLPKQLPNR